MLRESLNLTTMQMAGALGWLGTNADRTILGLESGRRNGQPSVPTAACIATLRGLAAAYLARRAVAAGEKLSEVERILCLALPKELRR
jgi:transcriptional regulator with XRE-family HTH domain